MLSLFSYPITDGTLLLFCISSFRRSFMPILVIFFGVQFIVVVLAAAIARF